MNRLICRTAFALLAAFAALPAGAVFRAYVASTGSDANPCTLPAPCRLLPAALAVVDDGGEIWMLDSANYNTSTVTIDKGVTILAIPGALGSLVGANNTLALVVNAPGKTVTLRNLVMVPIVAGSGGVSFTAGDHLNVVDCEIANMSGIFASAPDGKLSVVRTVLRGNGTTTGIQVIGSMVASLSDLKVRNHQYGLILTGGVRATVKDSHISVPLVRATTPAGIWGTGGPGQRLAIENSTIMGGGPSTTGLRLTYGTAGAAARVTVQRSRLAGAAVGISVQGDVIAELSDTVVANNDIAGVQLGSGTRVVYTRGNNVIELNGNNNVAGGTLTPRAGL